MLTFGLVVEGDYDVKVIQTLVEKIMQVQNITFISRPCGGRGSLTKKYPGYLTEFKYKNVNKALIIQDCNGNCIRKVVDKLVAKLKDRHFNFPVKFHIVKREIETWLLADEKAIAKLTTKNISRIAENLEDIVDPKAKLRSILSKAGVAYTAEKASKIASEADLNIIAYRCPGFRRFRQSVLDC